MKKIILVLLLLFMLAAFFAACGNSTPTTSGAGTTETTAAITTKDPYAAKYEEAFALIKQGDSAAAYRIFEELGDYRDAKEQLSYFRYVPTKSVSQDHAYGNTTQVDFLYNSKNLPVKETYLHNGSNLYVFEYAYDARGNLTEWKQYMSAYDQVSAVLYLYDDNGRISHTKLMPETGPFTYGDYTYDANGNLSEIVYTEVSDGDDYVYRATYLYNANGNLTKSFYTDKDGVESQVYEYYYDSNGYLVKETFAMTGDSVDTVIEYSYNANGDLIQTVYNRGTENENSLDYTYDANRRPIQKVRTDAVGQKTVYDYTYDDVGNLIKTTTSRSGTVTETESYEYKFVYFPYTVSEQIESIIDVSQHIQ